MGDKKGSKASQRKRLASWRENVKRQEAEEARIRSTSFASLTKKEQSAKLEASGLLAYQTKGLSAEQVNAKYEAAGINITTSYLRQITGNAGIVSHSDRIKRGLPSIPTAAAAPIISAPTLPTARVDMSSFWQSPQFRGLVSKQPSGIRAPSDVSFQDKRIRELVDFPETVGELNRRLQHVQQMSATPTVPADLGSAVAAVNSEHARDGDLLYYNPRSGEISAVRTSFPIFLTAEGTLTVSNTGKALVFFPELALQASADVEGLNVLDEIYEREVFPPKEIAGLRGPEQMFETLHDAVTLDVISPDVAEDVLRDLKINKELAIRTYAPLFTMVQNKEGELQPFYFDEEIKDDIELERVLRSDAYKDLSWTEKLLSVRLPAFLGSAAEGLATLGEPALWLKEGLFASDNPVGSSIQVMFNAGIYGFRAVQSVIVDRTRKEERSFRSAEQLILQAEELEAAGEDGTFYRNLARTAREEGEKLKVQNAKNNANLAKSEQGLASAWENYLNQDWSIRTETYGQLYAHNADEIRERDDKIIVDADNLREAAYSSWTTGEDVEISIAKMIEAQALDRSLSLTPSHQEAYTWLREPENEEKFHRALAEAELQKGVVLTKDEVRRLKDIYVNPVTEMGGEIIFDPLNIIPAAAMEAAFAPLKLLGKGLPISDDAARAISKVLSAVGDDAAAAAVLSTKKIPGLTGLISDAVKRIPVIGPTVSYLGRESSRTAAGKLYNIVGDSMAKFSSAYGTVDDLAGGIDDLAEYVSRAMTSPQTIDEIFESAKLAIPGAKNLTLDEFRKLTAAGSSVSPELWGAAFRNSRAEASEMLEMFITRQVETEFAQRGLERVAMDIEITRRVQDAASNVKNAGAFATEHFSRGFSAAYLDAARVGDTALLRDSLSGKAYDILKNKLGGRLWSPIADAMVHVVDVGQVIRGIWSTFVLPLSPRWSVQNLIDSTGRSFIHGGSVLDDLASIFGGLGREFADEFDVIPLELIQTFSRNGLDFNEFITRQLLSGEASGGIFSYIAKERRRLGEALDATKGIDVVSGMAESGLKSSLLSLWDGFKMGAQAIPAGASDFNTAVEFTLRVRMFQREYYKILNQVEPEFLARALSLLPPEIQSLGEQIWKMSGSSPAKMQSFVDSIRTGVGSGQKAWSLITPSNVHKTVLGMSPSSQTLFLQDVQSKLQRLISTKLKSGVEPAADDFVRFFSEYRNSLSSEIQEHLSSSRQWMGASDGFTASGKAVDIPSPFDLKGSIPQGEGVSGAIQQIEAVRQIKLKKPLLSKDTPLELLFDAATGETTTLRRVDDLVSPASVVREGDDIFFNVGSKFDELDRAGQIDVLRDATLDAIRETDAAAIAQSELFIGAGKAGYDDALRNFVDNPTFYASVNQKEFVFFADQMERNPVLRYMYEKLAGKPLAYEDTANLFSRLSPIDAYADPMGYLKRLRGTVDDIYQPPPRVVLAGNNVRVANTAFYDNIRSVAVPDVLRDGMRALGDDWDVVRMQVKELGLLTVPGPRAKLPGASRGRAWEVYYDFEKKLYDNETLFKTEISELISKGEYAAAEARILEVHSPDFIENFLREVGFDITWDFTKSRIVQVQSSVYGRNMKMDRAVADTIFTMFYASDKQLRMSRSSMLMIKGDDPIGQISRALRDTFQLNIGQSDTIASTISRHADRWSSITKRPASEYMEKLGFRTIEDGMDVVDDGVRFFRNAGIINGEDGRVVFFGLDESATVEDVMSATGRMFSDDLRDMARFSPETAQDLSIIERHLEELTGKPVEFSGLKWEDEHQVAFIESFNRYLSDGHLGDLGLNRAFYKYKQWMGDVAESLEGSSLSDELTQEVRDVFHRMFIERKLMPESTHTRALSSVAAEQGISGSDDELLSLLNESLGLNKIQNRGIDSGLNLWDTWNTPGHQEDFINELTSILEGVGERDNFNVGWLDDLVSKNTESMAKEVRPEHRDFFVKLIKENLPVNKTSAEWDIFFSRLTDVQVNTVGSLIGRQLEINNVTVLDAVKSISRKVLDVEDVPISFIPTELPPHLHPVTLEEMGLDDASRIFSEYAIKEGLTTPIRLDGYQPLTKEISDAWDAFRRVNDWTSWPDDALASPNAFRGYLESRIAESPRDLSDSYRRTLVQVESFQNDVINLHAGTDYTKIFSSHVPEAFVGDGVKTWIRHNELQVDYYESAMRALDDWEQYLIGMSDTGHPILTGITNSQIDELSQFAKGAGELRTELTDLALNGGSLGNRVFPGSLDKVNKVMLDYGTRNNFDQIMSNIFPFWMFPSRSVPMWAESLLVHPELVAFYYKNQRLSQISAVQAGAVNSKGESLRSLKGYIPLNIGGKEFWFNPLAPLSFRYVIAAPEKFDSDFINGRDDQMMSPMAYAATETMRSGAHFGFSVAPWISWMANSAFEVPESARPNWPLIPQLSLLLPRWAVPDMVRQTRAFNNILPEVHWHDYLVEQKIYEDVLDQLQSGSLSDGERAALMQNTEIAIRDKENDLWIDARNDVYKSEYGRNAFAFVTGMYPKEFTDGRADLLALRNNRNLLRSALNNEMQAEIFDISTNDQDAYRNYINYMGTDEGQLYRWYTDSGWVKNPETGALITDPEERNALLAMSMDADKRQQLGYMQRQFAMDAYDDSMRNLPIGSSSKYYQSAYEEYATAMTGIDHLVDYGEYYGTYKPSELLQQDIQEKWYRLVLGTKPQWDGTGDSTNYEEYEARVEDWKLRLPDIGNALLPIFLDSIDILQIQEKLHEDQTLGDVFISLPDIATSEGMETWKLGKDDIYDALNAGHRALYWDPFWERQKETSGYARDFVEEEFADPPTAEEYYRFIVDMYGEDRFTLKEIQEIVDGVGQETVQSKLDDAFVNKSAEEQTRQRIWDLRSMAGPGGGISGPLEVEYIRLGGKQDDFSTWYLMSTPYFGEPDKLLEIESLLEQAIINLNISEPTREQKLEWVQAQDLNVQFKELVENNIGHSMEALHAYYYGGLDWAQRKLFRRQHPDEYAKLGEYQDIKDAFSVDNQDWAKYYNLAEFTAGERVVPTTPILPPVADVNVPWPTGFVDIVKGTMERDIATLYGGGNLSVAGRTYLDSLGVRYSNKEEWKSFIDVTIALDDLNSVP